MPAKRLFVLGAGFSKACGLPLARELTLLVWNDWRKLGDFNRERLEARRKEIRLLFPHCECDPGDDRSWPDFEQLITALDEAHRYQLAFERVKGTTAPQWAGDLKTSFMLALTRCVSELTDDAVKGGLGPVARFVTALDRGHDNVVSFNWDVLLEIAAADQSIPVIYQDGALPGLQLAKPHGSFNLVDAPRDVYERTSKSAANVIRLDEEFVYDSGGKEHVILRAQNPREAWLRQAWAPPEFATVVEPNIRKTYDSPWLDHQWVRALKMMQEADEIIVIGFSLPEFDLRPRLLFQLCQLRRVVMPKLTIVAPRAARLADHYRKWTGLNADPVTGTLEDWLDGKTGSGEAGLQSSAETKMSMPAWFATYQQGLTYRLGACWSASFLAGLLTVFVVNLVRDSLFTRCGIPFWVSILALLGATLIAVMLHVASGWALSVAARLAKGEPVSVIRREVRSSLKLGCMPGFFGRSQCRKSAGARGERTSARSVHANNSARFEGFLLELSARGRPSKRASDVERAERIAAVVVRYLDWLAWTYGRTEYWLVAGAVAFIVFGLLCIHFRGAVQ